MKGNLLLNKELNIDVLKNIYIFLILGESQNLPQGENLFFYLEIHYNVFFFLLAIKGTALGLSKMGKLS